MPAVLARKSVNRKLRKRLKAKHVKTLHMLRGVARQIDDKAKVAARVAAAHVEANDLTRAQAEVALLATGVMGLLLLSFRRLAHWSWSTTVEAFAREVPREPLFELAQQQEPAPGDEPEPPPADDDDPGLDVELMTLAAWTAFLAGGLFAQPRPEQVNRIIYAPVEGVRWPDRLKAWQRRSELQMGQTAFSRALQVRQGILTREALQRAILLDMAPMVLAAQRIAEHEGLRIAEAIQRAGYARLGPLLAGVMILNPVLFNPSHNARPSHRRRAGTIYWTEPGRQPNIVDMPLVPDEPNCYCWDAPVLALELA